MADQHSRGREECVVVIVSLILSKHQREMLIFIVNHDDYVSRWRNTNFTREEALSQIL